MISNKYKLKGIKLEKNLHIEYLIRAEIIIIKQIRTKTELQKENVKIGYNKIPIDVEL